MRDGRYRHCALMKAVLPTPFLALNDAASPPTTFGAPLALALAEAGKAPEWVQLMPAGPRLKGRDGREWTMADAGEVASATHLPFALDYEHAPDKDGIKGVETIAAGWCEELQIRNGEIWGRVDWTPKAARHVVDREYRFLSPGFTYRAGTGDVVALESASLVNRPNFVMTALNAKEDQSMLKEILAALGLPETATAADAAREIVRQRDEHRVALNAAQNPPLEKFVPRADFDAMQARATNAEQKIKDADKARHDEKVAAAIDGALKAGKITPASKDYHLANCATEAGLAAFEKFVAAQPSHFDGSGLEKKDPDKGVETALNEQEQKRLVHMGVKPESFNRERAAESAR